MARRRHGKLYEVLDRYVDYTEGGLPRGSTIRDYVDVLVSPREPGALLWMCDVGKGIDDARAEDDEAVLTVLVRWWYRRRYEEARAELMETARQLRSCFDRCSKHEELKIEAEGLMRKSEEYREHYERLEERKAFRRGLLLIESKLRERGIV